MPDKSYWQDRQEKKFLAGEKKVNTYYKELEKSFEQSKREIQKVINDFVMRYGVENESPSYATAMRKLNKTEIGDLQAFIDLANENMGKYNQELNNMSYKARITRYQALEKQIDAILQQLYAGEFQYKGEELLKEVYSDSYYQTWFNIDQYHGFHQEFAQVNAQTVEELIKYPFNGADFSTRIWKQKDHMLQKLNESITTMLIQGRNPNTLSREFAKTFGTKEFEAYRLLHTEGSFVMGQGTLAAYKEDGVEKYQILATLDIKTSNICRKQDGKVYDVDKAVVGVNYWPFHMSCRTTDVPYYDDEDYSQDTRVARDPVTNKSYDVPADMTYKEWHEKYIESNPNAVLVEKKWKNSEVDKKQFEKYKLIFGDEIHPKLEDFQELKYNSIKKWEDIKAKKQETLNSLDYRDSFFGKFGDKEVREWYISHDENIPNLIDKSKDIEIQAKKAHALRNKYRTEARNMMKNQAVRAELDIEKPNRNFEELLTYKTNDKNMSKEEAIKDILKTATKTNKKVNKSLGLE